MLIRKSSLCLVSFRIVSFRHAYSFARAPIHSLARSNTHRNFDVVYFLGLQRTHGKSNRSLACSRVRGCHISKHFPLIQALPGVARYYLYLHKQFYKHSHSVCPRTHSTHINRASERVRARATFGFNFVIYVIGFDDYYCYYYNEMRRCHISISLII